MKVFLDAEFTDLLDCDLLSLGMVSENGQRLYVEIADARFEWCSPVVQENILPLLGKDPQARVPREQAAVRVAEWLAQFEEVDVLFDYQLDWELTADLLQDQPLQNPPKPRLVNHEASEPEAMAAKEAVYRSGVTRHHALGDALALKAAWLARSQPAK